MALNVSVFRMVAVVILILALQADVIFGIKCYTGSRESSTGISLLFSMSDCGNDKFQCKNYTTGTATVYDCARENTNPLGCTTANLVKTCYCNTTLCNGAGSIMGLGRPLTLTWAITLALGAVFYGSTHP